MSDTSRNIGEGVFTSLTESFVLPEIQRRIKVGELPTPFPLSSLNKIQILFYTDDRPPAVRLNDEVRAVATVKIKKGLTKAKGEDVYASEIEGVSHIQPADEESDYGHASFLRVQDAWHGHFCFLYYQGLARKCAEAAAEFLDVARYSLDQRLWRPFFDCLFSASELAAKALLLAWGQQEVAEQKRHQQIHSRFNLQGRIGNAAERHVKTFNMLSQFRGPARYQREELQVDENEAHEYYEHIQGMIDEAERWTTH